MRKRVKKELSVSIVIPTYNRKNKVMRLLDSIFNSNYSNFEIIVIDDASTDGVYEEIRKAFPKTKVIRNLNEKLPSMCRNIGIKNSKGELIFFIDDDNVVKKMTLRELAFALENSDEIGLVGPVMYYYTDPKRIWCAGAKLNKFFFTHTHLLEDEIDNGSLRNPFECDYIPNAYLVKREVLEKVGVFDNVSFPLAFEEIDLAERVRRAGYKIVVVPTATVWHDIPSSIDKPHRPSKTRSYLRGRSRVIFYRKYARWRISLVMFDILYFCSKKLLYHISFKDKITTIHYYIKGVLDGFGVSIKGLWRVRLES